MSIALVSGDGDEIRVPLAVAKMSGTVRNMLEDIGGGDNADTPVPLPNISTKTLAKVIEYCAHHVNDDPAPAVPSQPGDPIAPWDAAFCGCPQDELFAIILASNYLDIGSLLDVTCKAVALMIKGKTPDEIRATFNIKNDFTAEEEEQVRRENEWCEER